MDGGNRTRRLRWLCRRGMRELDVLLERFIERNEARLAAGAWPGLEDLLSFEDDVLWDILQDPGCAAAGSHAELLRAILDARAIPA